MFALALALILTPAHPAHRPAQWRKKQPQIHDQKPEPALLAKEIEMAHQNTPRIITLTMNPTIDVAYRVARLHPTRKIRADSQISDPGGGGINVARVLNRLGANVCCHYLSGGATGATLDGLLERHELMRHHIPVSGDTRISTTIFEEETGDEFRIVSPGPILRKSEWEACLSLMQATPFDYLVASGSLPQGAPVDFYSRLARIAAERKARLVLDTSGEPLKAAIAGGGLYLIKPSLGEFRTLTGLALETISDVSDAASRIVKAGQAAMVAVTMGHRGAVLAFEGGTLCLPAVETKVRSTVGAGDSFVAAMVHALADGEDPAGAFRNGIAGGTAAILTPGTDLAFPEDIALIRTLVGDNCRDGADSLL